MLFSDPTRCAAALVLTAMLAACGAPPPATGIQDPYEESNRRAHEFNRELDRRLVRPVSSAFGEGEPGPVGQGVINVGRNLGAPAQVVNKLLQARIEDAVHNTVRFALNTTIGIGGLFDPATAMGLDARPTDFGETLHVWGMGEGDYLEIPVIGASTERDALGMVVDALTDPVGFVLPSPEKHYARAFKLGSRLGDRGRFADSIDSILYDSADSYAQARLLYLQSRRFQLGQEAGDDDFFDPYDDPYGEDIHGE